MRVGTAMHAGAVLAVVLHHHAVIVTLRHVSDVEIQEHTDFDLLFEARVPY